jgi:hypothetical protein
MGIIDFTVIVDMQIHLFFLSRLTFTVSFKVNRIRPVNFSGGAAAVNILIKIDWVKEIYSGLIKDISTYRE